MNLDTRSSILDNSRTPEYFFEEGCFITEWSNVDSDPHLSIARCRLSPQSRTRWHRLKDTTERYVILAGTGWVELGDRAPQLVRSGDIVIIPSGCAQRIRNEDTSDLVFLALCTPRFTPACYEDCEPAP